MNLRRHSNYSTLSAAFSNHPKPPPSLTPPTTHQLRNLILNSQWHFIKHLAPTLTPPLISTTLLNFHSKPTSISKFLDQIHNTHLNIDIFALSLVLISSNQSPKLALHLVKRVINSNLTTSSDFFVKLRDTQKILNLDCGVSFDYWIRGLCQLKKAQESFKCFNLMKKMGVLPKVETCNDMLSLFIKLGFNQMVWVLYAEMFKLKISSNTHTFNIMINVLCKEGKFRKALEFVDLMEISGVKPNVVTYNTLINGYCAKCKIELAKRILSEMKVRGFYPDSYSYGSIINGLCKEGRLDEGVELFGKMVERGVVPCAVTYNCLIDGYCNRGDLYKAFEYRDEMVRKGIGPTLSSYNVLIHALFVDGKDEVAGNLIKEMEEKGLKKDDVTFNILINGYCRVGMLRRLLRFMMRCWLKELSLLGLLILLLYMY